MKKTIVLVIACLAGLIASAQMSENQVTAQPGFYISSYVMHPGNFQVESNYTFSRFELGSIVNQSHAVPNVLLRYGIADGFEVRAAGSFSTTGNGMGASRSGFSPPALEMKLRMVKETDKIPGIAFRAGVRIPGIGSSLYDIPDPEPAMLVAIQKGIGDKNYFFVNLGMNWPSYQDEALYSYAVAYERLLAKKVVAFIEAYGFLSQGVLTHKYDGGAYFILNPNLQLDISGGIGFFTNAVGESRDYFLSLGISHRILAQRNR